ncbi:MAG: AIR synthase family protein [Thermoanaerobacterales bacterium]|nr:AIR synthase family protein [Bacillota bacterium]MDI6905887.1 AIR synthase family protein [Thermoanaerobacterales bacterium]
MPGLPTIGKISPDVFRDLIYPRLGAPAGDVLVGPQSGVDVGIVEIGDRAVSFTSDPVFVVPAFGWEKAAWFAVHILLSDAVTCGLRPRFLSIDLNLPMEMGEDDLAVLWDTIHCECVKYGVSIICGHTGRYEGCHYPMVGGATVIGIGGKDEYVTPRLARPGDMVIVTKGPAIEAAGILATVFPDILERKYSHGFRNMASDLFFKMSVVEDAFTAVGVGLRDDGVSAMHDATECGVLGGLYELAQAAGLGLRVDKERIVIEPAAIEICRFFGIDPYIAISEGTLIIACREYAARAIVEALSRKGITSSVVGELTEPEKGMAVIDGTRVRELEHPVVDPFWQAFDKALGEQGRVVTECRG